MMTDQEIDKIISDALKKNDPQTAMDKFYDYCMKQIELNIQEYCLFCLADENLISVKEYQDGCKIIDKERKYFK